MPYTIYKTNGIKLTTVEDGKLNLTTDLQLVGKNYAGYGQIVNENLVRLLENFSNGTSPSAPLIGQLWYDTINKKLKVYSGTKWNQFLSTTISANRPVDLSDGEFWFDSSTSRLYIKNNGAYTLIGPSSGAVAGGDGSSFALSTIQADSTVNYNSIQLTIDDSIVAVVSGFSYTVNAEDPIITKYTKIHHGITLEGAHPDTGVSSNNNTYFWGTAADSARLDGREATDYLLATDVNIAANSITSLENITYISTGGVSIGGSIEGAWELTPGSTLQATYADLAERYEADAEYEPGTVLVIGGNKEVTISTTRCDPSVAGIVSTNPAYMMNKDAGNDKTHPYIALKGRVPCKVIGNIKKGDLLTTSGTPGVACAMTDSDWANPNAVIGKALEDYSSGLPGIIEVKI